MMITYILTLVLFMNSNPVITPNKTIGIWQVSTARQRISGKSWVAQVNPSIFSYDGQYVTLWLFTEKEWMWKSKDDYYKLKTEWRGDRLFYQPPFGKMTYLATFREGRYQLAHKTPNGEHIWVYEKISKEEVPQTNQAILVDRKVHDYTIRSLDKRD